MYSTAACAAPLLTSRTVPLLSRSSRLTRCTAFTGANCQLINVQMETSFMFLICVLSHATVVKFSVCNLSCSFLWRMSFVRLHINVFSRTPHSIYVASATFSFKVWVGGSSIFLKRQKEFGHSASEAIVCRSFFDWIVDVNIFEAPLAEFARFLATACFDFDDVYFSLTNLCLLAAQRSLQT